MLRGIPVCYFALLTIMESPHLVATQQVTRDREFQQSCGTFTCDLKTEYCEGDEIYQRCALCEDLCIANVIKENPVQNRICQDKCPVYMRRLSGAMSTPGSQERSETEVMEKEHLYTDSLGNPRIIRMANMILNICLLLMLTVSMVKICQMSKDVKALQLHLSDSRNNVHNLRPSRPHEAERLKIPLQTSDSPECQDTFLHNNIA